VHTAAYLLLLRFKIVLIDAAERAYPIFGKIFELNAFRFFVVNIAANSAYILHFKVPPVIFYNQAHICAQILLRFIIKHTVTKAFKVGISDLVLEFTADAFCILGAFKSARAVAAGGF